MPEPQPLPPIATSPLSVVILAHNAAAHVVPLLGDWITYLEGRGQQYELILVDDGSSDGTADLAVGVAEKYPRVKVLRNPVPQGEGAALRAALAEAKMPLLFYTLCQPEYRPEHLGLLLDKPAATPAKGREIDHAHIMGGFRAGVPMPLALRILGWLSRAASWVLFGYAPLARPGWLGWRRYAGWLTARVLFGLRYHDVGCPVRLMRRDIFARIPIQSNSAFVHVEILAKANFLGHLMAEEVPLPIAPPPYRGDFKQLWRDGKRMFQHPDFGPAVLEGARALSQP